MNFIWNGHLMNDCHVTDSVSQWRQWQQWEWRSPIYEQTECGFTQFTLCIIIIIIEAYTFIVRELQNEHIFLVNAVAPYCVQFPHAFNDIERINHIGYIFYIYSDLLQWSKQRCKAKVCQKRNSRENSISILKLFSQNHWQVRLLWHLAQRPQYVPLFRRLLMLLIIPWLVDVSVVLSSSAAGPRVVVVVGANCCLSVDSWLPATGAVGTDTAGESGTTPSPSSWSVTCPVTGVSGDATSRVAPIGIRIQNGAMKPTRQTRIARTRKTNPTTRSAGTSLHMAMQREAATEAACK